MNDLKKDVKWIFKFIKFCRLNFESVTLEETDDYLEVRYYNKKNECLVIFADISDYKHWSSDHIGLGIHFKEHLFRVDPSPDFEISIKTDYKDKEGTQKKCVILEFNDSFKFHYEIDLLKFTGEKND